MKKILKISSVLILVALCSNCSTPRHYKAHLFGQVTGNSYKKIPTSAVHHGKEGDDKIVKVRLAEVYMGELQRKFDEKSKAKSSTYAGKELWVIAHAKTVDSKHPLLPADAVYVAATSVKLDQESFSPIPISHKESLLFNLPSGRDYRVTIKVYEVDRLGIKRAFYRGKDTDFGKLISSTVTGTINSINNALFKSLLDSFKEKSNRDLALEEFLLASGSDLEFQGSFYLYEKSATGSISREKDFAMVDLIRSNYDYDGNYHIENIEKKSTHIESIQLPALGRVKYVESLRSIRNATDEVSLDAESNYKMKPVIYTDNSARHLYYQSYVKFAVE